jgi:ribosomal protein S2
MSSFLLGERGAKPLNSHIFDLSQTLFLLKRALKVVKKVAAQDGQILFLGRSPKKVAKITKQNNPYDKIIENAAIQCSQPYITGQTK